MGETDSTHTRLVVIKSDQSVGQFLENKIESIFAESDQNISVEELDLNSVPSRVYEDR